MPVSDPYGSLGLSRTATDEDVRKAYRKLAREHHPDANPDDSKAEERFKEIQEAYEILSKPEKRREYDERSRPSSRKRRGTSRTTTGSRSGGQTSGPVNVSDLFEKAGGQDINWHLRVEGIDDITRISKVLGIDLTRLSKLAGEDIKMRAKKGFEEGRSGKARVKKPPKPGKPPKTRKPRDAK